MEALIEAETAGDPMTGQKWLRRDLRQLSTDLKAQGFDISHVTVGRLLKQQDYSLKSNHKAVTAAHPERDRQFCYIERVKRLFQTNGHPVISVDTKKKELIGNFKNSGQQWRREAARVNAHDFPEDALLRTVPYGIYDVAHNLGYVYVGVSADTPAFAVDAICRWWHRRDRPRFTNETKLLILCDAGGSNSYRSRDWKRQLQTRLADVAAIEVMVCHYPTGASKWNPIEHRLFNFISLNWAGIPLRSLAVMMKLIRGTTTVAGLKVKAAIIQRHYPKGVKVSDQEMATLNLHKRRICPQWNYIFKPRHSTSRKT
ncbi:MAG: ISAzo13 family transposase [Leptolyngbyaceae cyanobacterium SM1_4_3]|nr:ISAzo13 family transposase [Leptolyngbyaceae cyanobacterium SM1_4_3]